MVTQALCEIYEKMSRENPWVFYRGCGREGASSLGQQNREAPSSLHMVALLVPNVFLRTHGRDDLPMAYQCLPESNPLNCIHCIYLHMYR